MKVKTIDGKEYDLSISSKIAAGNKRKCSQLHTTAREILRKKYPNSCIYEEVPIIVEKKQKLYLDFFLPSLNLAVEVNGKQHYIFNNYHHKSTLHFRKMQMNDRKKKEWCEINNIRLVILPYNNIYEWQNII